MFVCVDQYFHVTRKNVGRSHETGVANGVTELHGGCHVSEFPPSRLLKADGIQETTELKPVLSTVYHLWSGAQDPHLAEREGGGEVY